MATQNYAEAHLGVLDESFFIGNKTELIVNNGIRLDFDGKQAVTIYNMDPVAENDYIRDGVNRFGALAELGTGTQRFILSQDKAFTFTVDRGNLEDSMMAQETAKAVQRQVREVSVPTTDIYRLATLAAYAVANSQTNTVALTASNTYQYVLAAQAIMDNLLVPEDQRVLYGTPSMINFLKRDPEYKIAAETSYADGKKGIVSEVDGLMIVKVPASYLPANTGFMIVHKKVLVAPTKFDMVRVLDEVQGIDGKVAEGRRYYDAFIPSRKGKAIYLHKIA